MADDYEIKFVIEAAKRGNDDQMQELLDSGFSIHDTDSMGNTALHWAAAGGHEDAVALAIKFNVDINAVNKHGDTALHKAVVKNHIDAIAVLVQSGANLKALNSDGKTAFDIARSPEARKLTCPPIDVDPNDPEEEDEDGGSEGDDE
eukprot:CAMPEP_0184344084 /NCGR_PEP_ID=MMETSP1089-20130417/12596_1 /TAXON_ID=38269 ORGANISM="Gloeochaete wittrockiana, Strain SAG46.84" /NCGR_SAMPLE_ID=MMETSP1089 /ASSEMBLY_ACC=CAM_ASM_000445 /LENGTH=146 /DNA_ID=CAMNT_0026673731 /DNA_START=69 /DNA_END=509 /DNA_ORIENTATION=+